MIRFIIPACFIFFFSNCTSDEKQNIIDVKSVKTEAGLISGKTTEDGSVKVFQGVPYAEPPVGDLRWKAPLPLKTWKGIRKCTKFSASAMQSTPKPFWMWTSEFIAPEKPLSEDCLYLNIWTAAKNKDENRPVIVFIHGGGFSSGSGSVPIYDGTEMARKGVVFITINYRVGIFGFFAHPWLTKESPNHSSGNYGLLDQIEALKWIKKNIVNFGGNPNNITIAGQSAGAFSVNFLVASPIAKGLFQKAIAESGGAILPTNLAGNIALEQAEQAGKQYSEKLNAKSIAELRDVPAEDLLKTPGTFIPVIDGYVLPRKVYTIFSEGKQNDVPLITGWNADEGNFSGPPLNAEKFKQKAKETYGDKAEKFLKLFPSNTDEEAKQSQTELSQLTTFGLQAYAWMKIQNETGESPVFMYHFARILPYGEGQQPFGAFHTGEVPYAYNNLHMSNRPWKNIDHELANIMSSYWANFAATGNPNGNGLPEWLPCSSDNLRTIFLDKDIDLNEIPQKKRLEFLEKFYQQTILTNPIYNGTAN